MKRKMGVSLAELLAVVVIMGIIAAIAIPLVGKMIEDQKIKAIHADAIAMAEASELYCLTNQKASYCDENNILTGSIRGRASLILGTAYDTGNVTPSVAPGIENYISFNENGFNSKYEMFNIRYIGSLAAHNAWPSTATITNIYTGETSSMFIGGYKVHIRMTDGTEHLLFVPKDEYS